MKIDKLIEKTTEKDGVEKWKVVVGIVVGLGIGLLIFCSLWGFFINPMVDDYLQNKKDIVAVYDFLDLKVGSDQTVVYFIGSSIVGCGIDSYEINRILRDNGLNIVTYNIAIDGTNARQRSLLTQNIIDSEPDLVIFGESYHIAVNNGLNHERIFVVADKLKIRDDQLYLYNSNELEMINRPASYFDKKRFVSSALAYHRSNPQKIDLTNTYDLYTVTYGSDWRHNQENRQKYGYRYEGIVADANRGGWSPVITKETTPAKEAMKYNAQALMDAGIPVVILNMPLHPLVSERVTEESRENFFEFLDSTGALWYDYEFACPDDEYWYKDGHHIAPETGAKMFAPQMAELIIELEESNVIHHS